jgi:4-amino-4-deoxy-L-arabinose transferase-like glycosyltransferase
LDDLALHHSTRVLVLLVVAGFGLRLLLRLPAGESSFLDNGYTFYTDIARTFLEGHGFCGSPGEWCAGRMPIYPLLISPLLAAGWVFPGLIVVQAAIGGGMTWIAWRLGLELFDTRTGLLAAGMTAFSPYAMVHDTALQETVLLNALLALGVALLLQASRSSSGRLFAAAGLALALAVLTSARVGLVLPVALAWTAVGTGRTWKRCVRDAVLLALPIALLVGGWMIRNWTFADAPALSTETGESLWYANNPWTFSHFPHESIDLSASESLEHLTQQQASARETIDGKDEAAVSRLMTTWAFDYVRTHPVDTIVGSVYKVWVVVSAQLSPSRGRLTQTGYLALYGTIHFLALIGLWRFRANWRRQALVWLVLWSFLLTTAVFWAHTSHKSVIDIFLFVYAGGVLSWWLRGPATRGDSLLRVFE